MKLHFTILILLLCANARAQQKGQREFTESFMPDSCTFETTGRNNYFILEPGYQLTFEGVDKKGTTKLVITVLNETRKINGVETRVVEEHEVLNGKTIEISRNFFVLCKQSGSIFYFGEDVDNYKDGKIVDHESAWLAEGNNKPGIMMPGLLLIGSRFYNEIAPGVAMDRLEIISTTETITTPAGTFSNCIKMEETTPIEPKVKDYKVYAPGIGLVKDGDLLLTKFGYIK